jgi:hypothetical protein
MVSLTKNSDLREIRKRAAQIRSLWSPSERLRRTGLPPDVPPRLRDLIIGCRQPAWSISKENGSK